MNSSPGSFVSTRRMNIYEPFQHHLSTWMEGYRDDTCTNISAAAILAIDDKMENQSEDTSSGALAPLPRYEQEASKPPGKTQRRLAQNREAARKSRMRKKAYVQQLETSRLKLIQLEQEVERARQQGLYVGSGLQHMPFSSPASTGITTFEMDYGRWVEEQDRQICEMRTALQSHITDVELRILVDNNMNQYFELFRIKAAAAKADVFYLMSGMWKTPAERFFSWIGGFRPSEILKVLRPLLDDLTDKQQEDTTSLQQSCQQAEDALSQGMDRLQQHLAEAVAAGQLGEGNYIPQVTTAMDKLDALVSFVNQTDHLRQQTLQQMHHILTTRQAARALLALGEYFQRLRALSSLWSSRPAL